MSLTRKYLVFLMIGNLIFPTTKRTVFNDFRGKILDRIVNAYENQSLLVNALNKAVKSIS
jgi:hypothetical protein